MNTSNSQLKCGYCGWLLNIACQNLWEHRCFASYDERESLINVDQNSIVTISVLCQLKNCKKSGNIIATAM